MLTEADSSTTQQISCKEFTSVRLNFLFRRAKHQSGENLVCPTGKNEYVIFLLLSVSTLHMKYWRT
jgi:hypothetical protein